MANWLESLFAFLFKYRPAVFEKGDFALGSPTSVIVLLIAGALIGIPAILTYAAVRGKSTRRDRLILGALRGAAILLVVFCLFRPMLLLSAAVPQRNYIGVLIDDSRSMQIADVDAGDARPQTRADVVRHLVAGPDSSIRKALGDRFLVRYFRFSSGTQRIVSADDVTFTGTSTRLGDAIEHARQELEAVPLSGLVLFTDGADNARTPLGDELLSLRAKSVPVFTVGVGRDRFDKDIEIRRVETARTALKGSALVADVLVRQRGYGGQKVPLVVEDEGRVIASQDVALPADGDLAPVRIHVAMNDAGPRTLTFKIAAQPGEQVTQNNSQQALVVVRDQREKILYVEGEPRYEMMFIRRAVANDSNLQLVTLQRTAENKFLRLDVDNGEELAGGFPKTREELFKYRGIILGSVDASFFTRDQLQMLADFVSVRGGGMLLLGGRHAFGEGGYAGTPLAPVMPVVIAGEAVPDSLTFLADIKPELTPAGAASAATQVAATDEKSSERWKTVPAVTSVNFVRGLKPGAVVLVNGVVPDGQRADGPEGHVRHYEQPVLAYQRYGKGLAIALPVQDTYLWRMESAVDDQTFVTFWRQMLRWLTSDVPNKITVSAQSDVIATREPIALTADVADSGFVMRNDAHVVAHVTAPSGATRDIPMEWAVDRDGEYRATFTPDEAGNYQIIADASTPSGSGARARGAADTSRDRTSDPTYVRVNPSEDASREFVDAEMRASLLQRISRETGGKFYTPATVSSLPEDIALSRRGVTVVNQMDLWDMPFIFLTLVGLVCGEWGYRKKRGLV
ncbi:MAG TPA: vWA domain-containing protein [Gemmatimonadaceae bacterium]|nr:vWA domain-containing protein [Gemmatimonadaceae bacterium]